MTEGIIVKMSHGPIINFIYKNRKPLRIGNIEIIVGKNIVEAIYHYKSIINYWSGCYINNKVHFIIKGTKNIKQILGLIRKVMELNNGDSCMILRFNNICELQEFIKFSFGAWNLERLNPRDKKDWPELAKKCSISYWDLNDNDKEMKKIYFYYSLNEVLQYLPDKKYGKYVKKTIEFIEKYGDDLAHYLLKYVLENNEIIDYLKYIAEEEKIEYKNIIEL